jgi:hypothetical protein
MLLTTRAGGVPRAVGQPNPAIIVGDAPGAVAYNRAALSNAVAGASGFF